MNQRTIRKAIIPAAGLGLRLRPITNILEKPLLPIGTTPLLQILVEQMAFAGITDIIVVVNSENSQVKKYLKNPLFRTMNKASGAGRSIKRPALPRFHFCYQRIPRGTGDAILHARKFLGPSEPAYLQFPDILIKARIPAVAQLINAYQKTGTTVLGIGRFYSKSTLPKYATIKGVRRRWGMYQIERYIERPTRDEIGTGLSPSGCAVITPEVFQYLKDLGPTHRGEIEFPDAINNLIQAGGKVYGHRINGRFFNCGEVGGYVRAFTTLTRERRTN